MTPPQITTEPSHTAAIPSLDGIRAIAVGIVFFAHTGLEHIVPGGLGVTIFFVLSGYLISTLLRIEHRDRQRIDYRGFYLRRALRLMPPLLIVVILIAIVSAALNQPGFSLQGLLAVIFYFGNYYAIANDFAGLPAGLGIVWSLAVEEHYYLLYPPLAALLLRIGRVGLSATTLVALCAGVFLWRCWLVSQGVSDNYLTMASDTRIDAILVGCLLALWRNPWVDGHTVNASRDAAFIAASLLALLGSLLYRDEFFRMTLRYSVQSVAVAVLLYYAVAYANVRPFSWLNHRALVYVGTISYTVYLSHHFILNLLATQWPQLQWLGTTVLALLLTLAVAEPMRRWVEQPCARLRRRLHQRTIANKAMQAIPQVASGGTL
jgi:peptidoglycan/LPS O-acetylase OafA/YrhL